MHIYAREEERGENSTSDNKNHHTFYTHKKRRRRALGKAIILKGADSVVPTMCSCE